MSFIPAFHFKPADSKLTRQWCNEVVQFYVYQNNLINLLQGKSIDEIEGYATGNYDMNPFKRMFRSLRKQVALARNPNIPKHQLNEMDKTGIAWERVALITPKLNTAVATLQKIPFEVKATCVDPLAQKKKNEDLEFLRNKDAMEDAIQPIYDQLNLGKVDMGTTKYSSVPFNALPLDLDVDDDDEFALFANLIYNLAPESAYEIIIQAFADTLSADQIRLLETYDQYKYGVSVNKCYGDKMTGLPNIEYIFPGSVDTDWSMLPDFSDNTVRRIPQTVTPLELFKYFPDEICTEEQLEKIVGNSGAPNEWDSGYCYCNRNFGVNAVVNKGEWGKFKMTLDYIEVKSVDYAMVAQKPKSKHKYITDDEKKCSSKIWGQNTYCFYHLRNTKWFFGIDRLPFANREKGKEVYQTFSTSIYRSQHKSAVELSIGENKKAQMAEIKLQHSVIMSLPPGKVIDLKYIRNTIEGLKALGDQYTMQEILDMAMEKNVHIIDTQGYEGKQNAGQYLAARELPGGLKDEIEGYYRVIMESDRKIDQFTNINAQLTGASANPEGLVGLQKLLINSSLNGIYYVNVAILKNYEKLYNLIAHYIKKAIEAGGAQRQAIENIIGTKKAGLIAGTKDIPMHEFGIKLSLGQREEERAEFRVEVEKMRQEGRIDAIGKYYILNTPNPKDAMFLAAMFERKANKREDLIRQEQAAQQQQLVEMQGQAAVANTQAQTQGEIQKIGAKANAEAQLTQLSHELGLTDMQLQGLIKRQLQSERGHDQLNKQLSSIKAKGDADQQKPII